MKFTLEWLNDYCKCHLPAPELGDLLTRHGLKVAGIQKVGGEVVFELEITANRPDCLSLIGIAREVALLTGGRLTTPQPYKVKTNTLKGLVQIDEPKLCPLYIGRVIKGIKVGPAPEWIARRLNAIGLRPVNNIVDITNYVLYETGQPLHAFDLDKLQGQGVIVRLTRGNEKITAIDNKEYTLSSEMLVIADRQAPVAIAGVMGGKLSEISEGTKDILLESAIFQAGNIRRTARRLALSSDSSYRFERGIDPAGVDRASRRAVELILQLAGGQLTAQQTVRFLKPKTVKVNFRLPRAERILGLPLNLTKVKHNSSPAPSFRHSPRRGNKSNVKRILKGLGLTINRETKRGLNLIVPSFRPDITREIDVIEEVIRIIGYEHIPTTAPLIRPRPTNAHKMDLAGKRVKDILVALGYNEVMTNSFLDRTYLNDFPLWSPEKCLGLISPDGSENTFLRNSLLPALLIIQATNQGYSNRADKFNLFEIAKNYYEETGKPTEKFRLALLDTANLYSLKGTLRRIFEELQMNGRIRFEPAEINSFTKGRTLKILSEGDKIMGWLGELSSGLVEKYELRKQPYLAEIDFELLSDYAVLEKRVKDFSRFPAIRRDLAMLFDRKIKWEKIESVIRQDSPDVLREVRFFDLYEGKNIAPDKKSLAFSLIFRSDERTLTNQEVDETIQKVIDRLGKNLGATLRT